MANARQLVRSFMSGGRVERLPLLPVAFYHAARIDGAPFEEVVWDATRLSRALLQQRELLGGDCIAVRFDDVWFAEAAGVPLTWSGELPRVDWEGAGAISLTPVSEGAGTPVFDVLLDVIDRLCEQLRRAAPVMAVVPGPLTLGARGGNRSEAAAVVRDLAERCCRAGAELVMLEEPPDVAASEIAAANTAILNTIRYFNAVPILIGPRKFDPALPEPTVFPANTVRSLPDGRMSGLVVPGDCIADSSRLIAFVAMLGGLPQQVFLVILDEALVGQSVEANACGVARLAEMIT